jgi:hypothetical protein
MVNVVDVFKINHNSCNIFQNSFLLALHDVKYALKNLILFVADLDKE